VYKKNRRNRKLTAYSIMKTNKQTSKEKKKKEAVDDF